MLIEFTVENFRSFKEPATFSMVAANLSSADKSLDTHNVFEVNDRLRLLKTAAIYGANASGKTNIIKAMQFMRSFVLNSSKDTQASEDINYEPFRLSVEDKEKPSMFEAVFVQEGVQYRYGFKADNRAVFEEWLYYVPAHRESNLFFRDRNSIKPSRKFKEGNLIKDKTRNNALFLSVSAQFNGEIASKVLNWFSSFNILSGLEDIAYRGYTLGSFENDIQRRDAILGIVRELDLGITNITLEKRKFSLEDLPKDMPSELKKLIAQEEHVDVNTIHKVFDKNGTAIGTVDFDIESEESEGTKKVFHLAGPLVDTLEKGKVLIIDELDARMHPLLTSEIVRLFNREENKQAQLIFTTHDTNLLSNKKFRRDQIWFAEKDRIGSTHIYSLAEFKIRNTAHFEKDYISGKYGAIPFLGDMQNIISGDSDAA